MADNNERGDLFMNLDQLTAVGVGLGLGLLVGMQREHAAKTVAGVRTFPLITLLGVVCGLAGDRVGQWLAAAGLLGVAALVLAAGERFASAEKHPQPRDEHGENLAIHGGTTTAVAALVMYGVGVLLAMNMTTLALIVGGVTAILLQLKQPLHDWIGRLDAKDWRAIFQFVLITLVILPVLPNQKYGPAGYQVLNPYKIWLLVVLIVGISLGAYVAYKLLGAKRGTLVGGILGGLISSTATTVSFARSARGNEDAKPQAATDRAAMGAVVIMLATAVVNVRVAVLMGVVSRDLLIAAWAPLAIVTSVMLAVCGAGYLLMRPSATGGNLIQGNPAQLKMAIFFAGMYALVLLAVAFAKQHFDNSGLYVVGAISGLTDLDAITLSMANTAGGKGSALDTAWRVVIVATVANMVFKAGVAAVIGGRAIFWRTAAMFAVTSAVCVALVLWWP